MEEISRGVFKLMSGRYLHANAGVIGIAKRDTTESANEDQFSIYEGYDGSANYASNERGELFDDPNDDCEFDRFTQQERIEISRFMVDRWRQWADDHGELE